MENQYDRRTKNCMFARERENPVLLEEKITVTGPTSEINSLVTYLANERSSIHVIKNSHHFPSWESDRDLYLTVDKQELAGALETICSRLASSSIYVGWIDISQVTYPICR